MSSPRGSGRRSGTRRAARGRTRARSARPSGGRSCPRSGSPSGPPRPAGRPGSRARSSRRVRDVRLRSPRAWCPAAIASLTIEANSSSCTRTRGCSRSSTPFSSAAEKDVFSISAWAPSLADANTDSTRAVPLRHRIPMRSPASSPSSAKPRASAFVRRSSSAQVTGPSESITAAWSGRVIAFTTQAVAGVVPHRWKARPARTSRSGRTGRSMPRRASTATDSACVCRGSRTARTLLVERGPAASRRRSDTVKLVIGSWGLATRALAERACRSGGGRTARLRRRGNARRRRPAAAPAKVFPNRRTAASGT